MSLIKRYIALTLVLLFMTSLFSCANTDEASNISSISFTRSGDIVLDDGSESGFLRIDGTGEVSKDQVNIIVEDESIAKVNATKISGYLIEYQVIPVSEGETYVYAATSDGSVTSEKLKITVMNEAPQSQTEETDTSAEPTESITELSADTYPLKRPEDTETEAVSVEQTDDIPIEIYYVLNTNTKKIHHSHCSSVKKIKPENYSTTDDPDSMLDEGYVWCKICG